jgi:N-acetylglucosaminyl-diphospho-decaprenol L-rhamnosyltransferase
MNAPSDSVADVSVVVVSYNAQAHLLRCLASIADLPCEVVVVENASTDGSAEAVRERFPNVRLVELERNVGFGAANNMGMDVADRRYVLLMNPDAWPVGDAIERLVRFVASHSKTGAVGPRLLNVDGTLQRSVRGYPTRWRLATEYLFLRWFAPRTKLLNAFYAANFDHRSERAAEFLVGAVLMLRREAVQDVGGFDPEFFMYNEEVDLCYRLRRAGWSVDFYPGAEFIHVGRGSSDAIADQMYREQLRSHLRFLAKHESMQRADQARRLLIVAMFLRSLVFRGTRRAISRQAFLWLRSGRTAELIHDGS